MRGVLAIYQNELAGYFRSPIAYFVVAVFLLGTGYFFLYNVFLTGDATMTSTFQNMGLLLLLVTPLLSMRLFAAEYGAGTIELLMTLPLHPWQIVAGKYLGAFTILLAIAVGTLIDIGGMWLTRFVWAPLSVLVIAGGTLFALGYTLITLIALYELWLMEEQPA